MENLYSRAGSGGMVTNMSVMLSEMTKVLCETCNKPCECSTLNNNILQRTSNIMVEDDTDDEESIIPALHKLCYSDDTTMNFSSYASHDDSSSDLEEELANDLTNEVSDVFDDLANEVTDVFDDLTNGVSDVFDDLSDDIISMLTNRIQHEENDDNRNYLSFADEIKITPLPKPEFQFVDNIENDLNNGLTQMNTSSENAESDLDKLSEFTKLSESISSISTECKSNFDWSPQRKFHRKNSYNMSDTCPSRVTSTPLQHIGPFHMTELGSQDEILQGNCNNFDAHNMNNSIPHPRRLQLSHWQPACHISRPSYSSKTSSSISSSGELSQNQEFPYISFDQALDVAVQDLIKENENQIQVVSLLEDEGFVENLKSDDTLAKSPYKSWCKDRLQLHSSCSLFPAQIAEQGAKYVALRAVYKHIGTSSHSECTDSINSKQQLILENKALKEDVRKLKEDKDILEDKLLALKEKKFLLMRQWKKTHREIRNSGRKVHKLEDQISIIRELSAQNIVLSDHKELEEDVKQSASGVRCSIM
ncbi:uncharacterized protein LOC100372368 [Saccoglossus kowalevskii]|uniref:Uncharacterized protein LOC100372368 n=1 Tax=Saccoglossus kowalevskii TaxID=10224 RepID=A0ABM0M7P6_SACKO|nr:PREDICTED: uncharacterized protein LOC100372368 [Saccoglossus kowalevskii]